MGLAGRSAACADDVAVRPVASALNHMDLWLTKGQPKPHLPHVPGCDVAGVVAGGRIRGRGDRGRATRSSSTRRCRRSRRSWPSATTPRSARASRSWESSAGAATARGWWCPPATWCPKPPGRTWEECAAYPLATLTAWRMLRRARLAAGERCLIVGIGGGVSTAALHLAVRMGAEVHVTSRDPAKGEAALALGAVAAHDSAEEFPVKAHVVVESVGPATWDRSVRALLPGGRLVVCGGTSGQSVEISLPRLFFKQYELIGSTMGSYGEFATVTDLMAQGLPVSVDEVFGLDEYPEALARLESGAQLGKLVLRHE